MFKCSHCKRVFADRKEVVKSSQRISIDKSITVYYMCNRCNSLRANKYYRLNKEKYLETRKKNPNHKLIQYKATKRLHSKYGGSKKYFIHLYGIETYRKRMRGVWRRYSAKMRNDPIGHTKILARQVAYYAKKIGKITPIPCEKCGNKKVEAHHRDYTKPLEVTWLCKSCHRLAHPKMIKYT